MKRRVDRADRLPIFEAVRAATLIDPFGPPRPSPRPRHLIEEVRMGRHHDDDHDGVADQDAPTVLDVDDHDHWAECPGHIGDDTGDDDGNEY